MRAERAVLAGVWGSRVARRAPRQEDQQRQNTA